MTVDTGGARRAGRGGGLTTRLSGLLRRALRAPANLLCSSSPWLQQSVRDLQQERDRIQREILRLDHEHRRAEEAAALHPLPPMAVLGSPHVAAKLIPLTGDASPYVVPREARQPRPDELPVPPPERWEGYGPSLEAYLSEGRVHVTAMRRIMSASGFPLESCTRILDFGCAAGRMIRFLVDLTDRAEIWGVDINEAHISWCQHHLSPPFRFVHTTTMPYLPFEDGYFDVIYAGSVFTHTAELADAWLLELRRVTKPSGRLFVSVHDGHFVTRLFEELPDGWLAGQIRAFDRETHFLDSDFAIAVVGRTPHAQVIYDIGYLHEHWGRFLTVVSVHEEAYGLQTVVLLEKPPSLSTASSGPSGAPEACGDAAPSRG